MCVILDSLFNKQSADTDLLEPFRLCLAKRASRCPHLAEDHVSRFFDVGGVWGGGEGAVGRVGEACAIQMLRPQAGRR